MQQETDTFQGLGSNESLETKISIIIPAHNEEKYLPRTLQALRQQTYGNYEIIVVANGCTDQTVEVAKAHGVIVYNLRESSLGKARNLGGYKATGDILLFLDADTILERDALAKVAREFTREYAMGTLKGVPDPARPSYLGLYFLKNGVHKTGLHHGSSGVILCWKDHFEQVHGFDENLYLRENSELMKRLSAFGEYKYIDSTPAITSMRRYERRGLLLMSLLWLKVWFLSLFSDLRHRTYDFFETPAQSTMLLFRNRRKKMRGQPIKISD